MPHLGHRCIAHPGVIGNMGSDKTHLRNSNRLSRLEYASCPGNPDDDLCTKRQGIELLVTILGKWETNTAGTTYRLQILLANA